MTPPEQLFAGVEILSRSAPLPSQPLTGVTCNPERVQAGNLFVALADFFSEQGPRIDTHLHLDEVIARGASCLLVERLPQQRREGICYLQVADGRQAAARLAANFHDHPSRKLKLIGVTGTNGKTSTATLLQQLFQALGRPSGLISTIENRIGGQTTPSVRTTPEAPDLQALLATMVEAGCSHCFMEVSSHGVAQQRIAHSHFTAGIFHNLSHDHLDFHGSLENYAAAKKAFFDALPATALALVNEDDPMARFMVEDTAARVRGFALHAPSHHRARILANTLDGLRLEIQGRTIQTRLCGDFNAYNLLAAHALATELGEPAEAIEPALSELPPIRGRFEQVPNSAGITAIVDYAHTPDALEKLLHGIAASKSPGSRVITVLGCGGNRDQEKRPAMARTAAWGSDRVIFTSDNPRREDPVRIIQQMMTGLDKHQAETALNIVDRRTAIDEACRLAVKGDVVLVAGKGHELYQQIGTEKRPFDDQQVLMECLCRLHASPQPIAASR